MSEKNKIELEDPKGVILAWLKESDANTPNKYITPEGMAYLNGYLQSNKTLGLVKVEKYDKLLVSFERLLGNYERLKNNKIRKFINKIFP